MNHEPGTGNPKPGTRKFVLWPDSANDGGDRTLKKTVTAPAALFRTDPKMTVLSQTDAWGIDHRYQDALGAWHEVPSEVLDTLHRVMGADPSHSWPPEEAPVLVIRQGERRSIPEAYELELEDGNRLPVENVLPHELPLGYHTLRRASDGWLRRLIVCPRRCWLPNDLLAWGWAAQLYAARSRQSWGIGDLADLRRLARWSADELGARILLINPLAAPLPLPVQQPSPYFASSRLFRSPLYLRIEEVPGAFELGLELEPLAAAGRDLNRSRIIDRNSIARLKMLALEKIWARFPGDHRFDHYCVEQGEVLQRYAVFCALSEAHGSGWPDWPAELRHPQSVAVARFAEGHSARVRFHQWLQWLLDRQLAEAGEAIGLIQDLPVGFDGAGADAWMWQDQLAHDVCVGSPPDEYSLEGQNWGLPPFIPHRLQAAGYEPFIQTIRASLRHSRGLRIDHVMGLFRLFWIPSGFRAADGAFVRYPVEDLLAIVALESQRAEAVVVGEDLGTVEEGVRERLAACGILSYRLLWFESNPPELYPHHALTAITTHDLPTVTGLWTGVDLEEQKQLGLPTNDEGTLGIRDRLCELTDLEGQEDPAEVIVRAHQVLARTPSMLVTATLEDAAEVLERPNIPGTTEAQRSNWSIALPVPLEDLERSDLPHRIAGVLRRASGLGAEMA